MPLNITRKDFVERLRKSLPHRYQLLSDDHLIGIALKNTPSALDSDGQVRFKPEPKPDPSFFESLWQPAKEQGYRIPEMVMSAFNSIVEQDWVLPNESPEFKKIRRNSYEAAKNYADELVAGDESLQAWQSWAAENPFEWSRAFEPAILGRALSSVFTSMGAVFGAGIVGGLAGGPPGAIMGSFSAGYLLESSEAYRNARQEAIDLGYTEAEVNEMAADAGLTYGVTSGVLEAMVPLSILRTFGLGSRVANKMFGRYAGKYVSKAAASNGKKASAELARESMEELVQENISIVNRITRYGKFAGIESLAEATTEGTQYLSEQAITNNVVHGDELTMNMLTEWMANPEFSESVFGGLLGGGIFSTPAGVRKARGLNGKDAAQALDARAIAENWSEEQYAKAVNDVIASNKFDMTEKVAFAEEIQNIKDNELADKIDRENVVEEETTEEPKTETKEEQQTTPEEKPPKEQKVPKQEEETTAKPQEPTTASGSDNRLENLANPQYKPNRKDESVAPGITERRSTGLFNYVNNPEVKGKQKGFLKEWLELADKSPETAKKIALSVMELHKEFTGKNLKDFSNVIKDIQNRQLAIVPEVTDEGLSGKSKDYKLVEGYFQKREAAEEAAREGIEPDQPIRDIPEDAVGEPEPKQKPNKEVIGLANNINKELNKLDVKEKGELRKEINSAVKAGDIKRLKAVQKIIQSLATESKKQKNKVQDVPKDTITLEEFVKSPKDFEKKVRAGTKYKLKESLGEVAHKIGDAILKTDPKNRHGKLIKFIANSLPSDVQVTIEDTKKYGARGRYSSGEEGIFLRLDPQSFKTNAEAARVFVHEAVHSISSITIKQHEQGLTKSWTAAKKKKVEKTYNSLVALRDRARKEIGEKTYKDIYGLRSDKISEFVAEVLTDPELQDALAEIKYQNTTVLNKFINLLKTLFDIKSSDSLLSAAFQDALILASTQVKPAKKASKKPSQVVKDKISDKEAARLANMHKISSKEGTLDDMLQFQQTYKDDYADKTYVDEYLPEEDVYAMVADSHLNRYFERSLGVYIPKNKYPILIKLAKRYPNITDEKVFQEFDKKFRGLIGKWNGTPTPVPENDFQYRNHVKAFVQSKNSSIEVTGELTKQSIYKRTRFQIVIKDGTPMVQDLGIYPDDTISNEDREKLFGINPVTKIKYSPSEIQDFVENDAKERGYLTKTIRVSRKNIYVLDRNRLTKENYVREATDSDFEINKDTIARLDAQFSYLYGKGRQKNLFYFLADLQGDTSQLIFGFVPKKYVEYTREDFIVHMQEDIDKGLVNKDDVESAIKDLDKLYESNPHIYAQTVAMHEKMKNIKGNNYATRQGSVFNAFKRLKLDFTKGTVVRGIGTSSIMTVDSKNVEFRVNGKKVKHLGDDGKYLWDGWLMTSKRYFKRLSDGLGRRSVSYKTVIRQLDKKKDGVDDYIAVKMMEMAPPEGMEVWSTATEIGEKFTSARYSENGYEVSSQGDSRFSAFKARLKDGRTIEEAYQLDVKGYRSKGNNPFLGKGKPPLRDISREDIWNAYLDLWRQWASENKSLIEDLRLKASGKVLTDKFANTEISQARALATILNETAEFSQTKVGEVIAKYEKGTWRDANNKPFDRLATLDEVKDSAGRFTELNKVHGLREDATRVIMVDDKSAEDAAFPINGFETILSHAIGSEEGRKVIDAVRKHYMNLASKYMKRLYGFIDNPSDFRAYLRREMQKGELPTDLQVYVEQFKDGKGLFIHYIANMAMSMINNEFLVNGLYKAREMEKGHATKLLIRPQVDIPLREDSIAIGSDNNTMLGEVLEASGYNMFNVAGTPRAELVDYANAWLAENDFWVLVHRNPIISAANVQPRKIDKFVMGGGQEAYMTPKDVFSVHEGDHDGDHVLIERVQTPEFMDAIVDYYKSGKLTSFKKNVHLEAFEPSTEKGSTINRQLIYNTVDSNSVNRGAQGHSVNAKTILSILDYKDFSVTINGTEYKAYKLDAPVVMRYWPLSKDKAKRELVLQNKGDEIIQDGDNYYLKTTKEHELTILIQAAVDNEKFGLINQLKPLLQDGDMNLWILTRIFYANINGKETRIPSNIDKNKPLARILRGIYNNFNYSPARRGIGNYSANVGKSMEIYSRYYDMPTNAQMGQSMERLRADKTATNVELERALNSLFVRNMPTIKVETNGNITPLEQLMSSHYYYDSVWNMDSDQRKGRFHMMNGPVTYKGSFATNKVSYREIPHFITMKEHIVPDFKKWWANIEKSGNKEVIGKVAKASRLADEMIENYNEVKKNNTNLNLKTLEEMVKANEYSEDWVSFTDKWQERFIKEKIDDMQRKVIFIKYLIGNKDQAYVSHMMAPQLVHLPTLAEYGQVYYSIMKNNNTMNTEISKHTDVFNVVKSIEKYDEQGKYCG